MRIGITTIEASDKQIVAPEHTAVRVALWRALHVQIDTEPHVMTDEIGLKLVFSFVI
jgi:hypothetical protein